jgi:hypothetical protein
MYMHHRPRSADRRAPAGAHHRVGLDRLIAAGRVSRPIRSTLPEPLELGGDPRALSRALEEVRGAP